MSCRKVLTLTLIRSANNILLGLKKRGFGKGKWNGFGGKIEEGETVHEAAVREVQEECGLLVGKMEKIGILEFEFVGEQPILEVHVFTTSTFEGEPVETEEMYPKWYSIEEVPFSKMWPDDKIWFRLFLANKKFRGYFLYEGHNKILKHTLDSVDHLPC